MDKYDPGSLWWICCLSGGCPLVSEEGGFGIVATSA